MINGGGSSLRGSRRKELKANHRLVAQYKGDRLRDENVIAATDAIVVHLRSVVVGRKTEAFALLGRKDLAGKQFCPGHQQQQNCRQTEQELKGAHTLKIPRRTENRSSCQGCQSPKAKSSEMIASQWEAKSGTEAGAVSGSGKSKSRARLNTYSVPSFCCCWP